MLTYFPYTIVIAAGRSDVLAKIYWLELIPYLLLVWWLADRYGAVGAAAAWSIRSLLDSILMFALAHRVGGVSYLQKNVPQFLAAAAIMLLPVGALAYFRELNLQVIALTLVAGGLYAMLITTRVLDTAEVAWLKGRIYAYLGRSG